MPNIDDLRVQIVSAIGSREYTLATAQDLTFAQPAAQIAAADSLHKIAVFLGELVNQATRIAEGVEMLAAGNAPQPFARGLGEQPTPSAEFGAAARPPAAASVEVRAIPADQPLPPGVSPVVGAG